MKFHRKSVENGLTRCILVQPWDANGRDKNSVAFLACKEKNEVFYGILNINKFIITYGSVYLCQLH